jgi:hypothetical protein
MQGRNKLRLESVQAATCGTENARESEDYFGRFFIVVLGAAFAMAPLHDNPQPGCRPNQVCPGSQLPICVPGKTCPIKL